MVLHRRIFVAKMVPQYTTQKAASYEGTFAGGSWQPGEGFPSYFFGTCSVRVSSHSLSQKTAPKRILECVVLRRKPEDVCYFFIRMASSIQSTMKGQGLGHALPIEQVQRVVVFATAERTVLCVSGCA